MLVRQTIAAGELAMIGGLGQVVRRIDPHKPLRYLTEHELAEISAQAAVYTTLANSRADGKSERSAF